MQAIFELLSDQIVLRAAAQEDDRPNCSARQLFQLLREVGHCRDDGQGVLDGAGLEKLDEDTRLECSMTSVYKLKCN